MKAVTVLAAGLAILMATPALAQDKAKEKDWTSNHSDRKACLQVGRIYSWKAPNNRTLIVENDSHQKFKLDLMGYCPGLTFKETIGLRSPGGSYLSCVGPGDTVFFHGVGMEMRCVISKVSAYTPDMEKADKATKDAKDKK